LSRVGFNVHYLFYNLKRDVKFITTVLLSRSVKLSLKWLV
jgi:hypothetical protein